MLSNFSTPCVLIPLSQGQSATIDAADESLVACYKWYAWHSKNTWYALRNTRNATGHKRTISLHRFLLDAQSGEQVDHVNGNALDCRRDNLRLATATQNAQNCGKKSRTSPYKGVSFDSVRCDRHAPRTKPWMAKIGHRYQTINIGRFATAEEAARAYDAKARELFGAFARLNFPD